MSESEIAELCRKIYWKHKKALDLIFEHRPDQQATIKDILMDMIAKESRLVGENSNKRYVRFALRDWDTFNLRAERGWSREGRLLLFEFQNNVDSLRLKLVLGPGPKDIRQKFLEMALAHRPPFKPPSKTLMNQFNELFSFSFLPTVSYEDIDQEQFMTMIKGRIDQKWQEFLNNRLPEITAVVSVSHVAQGL